MNPGAWNYWSEVEFYPSGSAKMEDEEKCLVLLCNRAKAPESRAAGLCTAEKQRTAGGAGCREKNVCSVLCRDTSYTVDAKGIANRRTRALFFDDGYRIEIAERPRRSPDRIAAAGRICLVRAKHPAACAAERGAAVPGNL